MKKLLQGSAPLAVTGLLMIGVLVVALIGLAVDPRLVNGAPAWLKPAKFAVSITIYTWTLAWIFTLIPEWTRTRRVVGRTSAAVFVVEMVIIVLQAARGVGSHFNVATPFDGILYSVMGIFIVLQTVTSVAVAVALWRHPFADRALGWGLRLGMTITLLGAIIGGIMAPPTRAQMAAARSGERVMLSGAHSIGGPDGGPGLPGTGWSTEHGDLRVSHFFGLHALQVLPLVAIVLGRRRTPEPARLRLTVVAAASYASLIAILLWQGLRGESVVAPDAVTLTGAAVWAALSFAAAWIAAMPRSAMSRTVTV